MLPEYIVWNIALGLAALLVLGGVMWILRQRRSEPPPLPTEWSLTARPVFSSDERRVYRQLREALPHHIVLSKLPLVRFCQPTDPQQVRYWYDLLGAIHVGFAICSANGRVLAAIDIDTDRPGSRRALQIKQKVLAACRVRYLRCPLDHLPSVPELQLLVPHQLAASRGPMAATPAPAADPQRGSAGRSSKRRQPQTLWQDSGFFQDSFFGMDSRADVGSPSEFSGLMRGMSVRDLGPGGEDDGSPASGASPAVQH